VAECDLPKVDTRVRFSLPALSTVDWPISVVVCYTSYMENLNIKREVVVPMRPDGKEYSREDLEAKRTELSERIDKSGLSWTDLYEQYITYMDEAARGAVGLSREEQSLIERMSALEEQKKLAA
jgi:hypothetical protein